VRRKGRVAKNTEGVVYAMSFKEIRKRDLVDNITRQYRLLLAYETKRDLSDRPKEVESANNEIGAIAQTLENYIEQYNEICRDEGAECSAEVRSIWEELQHLRRGQQQLIRKQDETLENIDQTRHRILLEIENTHRSLALSLLTALNEQEVRVVRSIMVEIDSNGLSQQEISEALNAIQTGYEELKAKSLTLVSQTANAEEVKKLWGTPDINVVGKLKLSIPLIPAILSYESELSFSIKQSLKSFWERHFKGGQVLL
jgi:chromosome segregation ATPase